jgi:hypothetical protein
VLTSLAQAAARAYNRRMSVGEHTGSCHCGAVRYRARLDLDKGVLSCNCSMCGRSGTLLTFIPAADFTLLSGQDALTDYQFNKHVIHHNFCKVCGIKPFARGRDQHGGETIAVNARCLEGVDVEALAVKRWNGRDH